VTKTVHTCDRCGAEKKETNHWYALDQRYAEIVCGFPSGMVLTGFENCRDPNICRLACGEKCLLEMVSEWAGQRDKPEASPTGDPTTDRDAADAYIKHLRGAEMPGGWKG